MNESSATAARSLVIFIHGFHDSATCWEKLVLLLREDPRFAQYDLITYEYPTRLLSSRWLRRLPSLKELGRGLAVFLESRLDEKYNHLTLVGHSMGGLVIQSALIELLDQGRGEDLKRVQQIILLATPHFGSGIASTLRRMLYTVIPNAQERSLRLLDPEVHDLLSSVQKRIVAATARTTHECPIPIHAFWGQQDGVVGQASARALFPNNSPLPGDHSSIIRPNARIEDHYAQIAGTILEPSGHQEIFEIEEYNFTMRVEPWAAGTKIAEHGTKRRQVSTNSLATVTQEARFSRKNRCSRLYRMAYTTQHNGFVSFHCSHENNAPPFVIGHWEDYGTAAEFHVRPAPREPFWMVAEVFGGFDDPCCDFSQHFDGRARVLHYVFTLDLTRYLALGRAFRKEPGLCVLPRATRQSEIKFVRSRVPEISADTGTPGIWRWELHHLHEGMVDVRWEFDQSANAENT